MPNKLEQLDREAELLLYLADELPAGQKANLEARLAADPQLAAELQSLRQSESACIAALDRADAHERLPTSESVAVRRVSRAMQQWHLDRVTSPVVAIRRNLSLPRWVYPTAAAAILLVGFLVWTSKQEVPPMEADKRVQREFQAMDAEKQDLAEWLGSSFDPTFEARVDDRLAREMSFGNGDDASASYLREEINW
jgi:hypothetical protein